MDNSVFSELDFTDNSFATDFMDQVHASSLFSLPLSCY